LAKLTGFQRRSLVAALQEAFPSREDLRRMVNYGLDENLESFVGAAGLQETAFQLVAWAEARGRLDQLLKAAVSENPSNPALQRFMNGVWDVGGAAGSSDSAMSERVAPSPKVPESNLLDSTPSGSQQVFVSYTEVDKAWAEWIAWQLEDAGYSTTIQAWDFSPGTNFVLQMDGAAKAADRTIAVLSPDYLKSRFAAAEWATALAQDPTGDDRRLLPVRVREFERQGLLGQIVYLDLVNLDEDAARSKLLTALRPRRLKPAATPSFPGTSATRSQETALREPVFPESGNPVSARRAVILTALDVEYKSVQAYLTNLHEEVHPRGTVYERGVFHGNHQRWDIGLVQIGKGNERAAFEVERAIDYFTPEVILFVGIAGGVKDVSLGDVIAASKVYGYESGKDVAEFRPRPELGQSSYLLIQRAQAVQRTGRWRERLFHATPDRSTPDALVAPIAAGGKVVASTGSATAALISSAYGDAVAVEMEGAGFLAAAHASQDVRALVVRGISDLIDSKAKTDAMGWQVTAAEHAAAFALEILDELGPQAD
jgi:nucleoside phosphorylase